MKKIITLLSLIIAFNASAQLKLKDLERGTNGQVIRAATSGTVNGVAAWFTPTLTVVGGTLTGSPINGTLTVGTSSLITSPNNSVTVATSNNGVTAYGVENYNGLDISAQDTSISMSTSNGDGSVNLLTISNPDGINLYTYQGRKAYYNGYELSTLNDLGNYVPYTGATNDVDLDTYSLSAKSVNIKGTGGAGHIGLKHQSSNITANASESSLGADINGDPVWKNDGYPLQHLATTDQLPVLTASTNITISGTTPNYTISSTGSRTLVVTPEDFGAVGDGVTNDKAALQSAVDYNGGNVIVQGTTGKNYFCATTFTTGDNVVLKNAVLSTTANISIMTFKGKNIFVDDVTFIGNSTGTSQRGIDLTGVSTFTLYYLNNQVSNCTFKNFGGAAIYATNIIGSSSGSLHEGAIKCNNVVITGCNYGVNFATRAEYNNLNNMSISSCTVGVSFTGGNNYISNSNITDNGTGLEVLTGTNDGHSGASNCAINHNTINFKATHTLGFSLDNCFLYAGAVTHTGTGKTKYNNCWFSMSSYNFTQTNSPVEMNNCEMVVLPNNFSLTGRKPVLNGCSSGTLTLCYPDRTFAPSYTLAANGTFTVPYSWGIESITIRNTTANAITGGLRFGTTNGGAEVVTAQAVGASEQVQILPQDIKKYFFAYNATTTIYVQAVTSWNSASIIMIVKLKQWNNF